MTSPTTETIAIIGDGAMGTTCGLILTAQSHRTALWSHSDQQAREMLEHRENRRFLPGFPLPESLAVTADDRVIFAGVTLILSAIPCAFLRRVWMRLKPHVPPAIPILSTTKGIENDSLKRPTEILADILPPRPLAVLSGPNIAEELARRLPATSTIAAADPALADRLQKIFSADWFRVYTNTDLIGVELAGATKNVIAIAAGIIDGLGAGDNAKAALLTRGLVEITRLGVAMGAQPATFAGLAGMGDLVTTCLSPKSRNRSFGQALGRGLTVEQALAAIPGHVEGVNTCRSLVELARRHHIEMPITLAVAQILFQNTSAQTAITALMTRRLKSE
jgi:glycerol-3-phosphate dehydrogenase (NAD(P)+)